MELQSTSSRNTGRWYLYTGAGIFTSALVYYVAFRSQLPWPGHLLNLEWARFSQLTDFSNGSYPSFAFTLSMGLMAVGLFVAQRSLLVKAILAIWSIGLAHEIFISTLTVTDVLAGTFGAIIALRIGLFATRSSLQSNSALSIPGSTPVQSLVPVQSGYSVRTKLAGLLFFSIVFATGTSPYEEIIDSDCIESDVNGTCVSEFIEGTPEYLSYAKLRSAVKVTAPRALTSVSRIYLYNSYIFANELNEGFHIIDNSSPTFPKLLGFVEIPGNQDITIKDDSLYADSYIDLVTIDISDIESISGLESNGTIANITELANIPEIARVEDVFPYNAEQNIPDNVRLTGPIDRTLGVVVGYQEVQQ